MAFVAAAADVPRPSAHPGAWLRDIERERKDALRSPGLFLRYARDVEDMSYRHPEL